MVRYIYADVLFVVNLVANYLVLLASGKLTGCKIHKTYGLLMALAGSVYATAALFTDFPGLFSLPVRCIFGCIMVILAFPETRGVSLIILVISFYLCSAVTAGTALAVSNSSLNLGINPVPWWNLAFALVLAGTIPFLSRIGGFKPGESMPLVKLDLLILGEMLSITGMVDTGNSLRDPVSGLPVMVVDWAVLSHIIPDDTANVFLAAWGTPFDNLSDQSIPVRLIPYSNISGKNGVIPGFKPDRITLYLKNGKTTAKEAIVGVSKTKLCPSGQYQALLHPDLVKT